MTLPISWRIIAKHLATGALLSAADLFETVYGQRVHDGHESISTITLVMLQLRSWLEPHDIEIRVIPDRGYFIPASQLDLLRSLLAVDADTRKQRAA
jgi:hypothetical protein